MVRYNQSPEQPIKGRPFRPDQPRHKVPHASEARDRWVADRPPRSILDLTWVEEFIALFALGTLGGAVVVFISFLAR